jgi:hypothetical protein
VTSIGRRIALALSIAFTTFSHAQIPAVSTPEELADRTEIESRPKSPVSGKVVDASTGKPISGARVELSWVEGRCTPWVGGLPLPRCARGTVYTPRFDPVVTGADGTFSFPAVPAGIVLVRAQLQGYFDASFWHAKPNTPSGRIEVGHNSTGIQLKLLRHATVHGVLVDEFDHPCAGWDVEYHRILLTQGRFYIESPPHTVAAAGDGTFSFEGDGDFYLTTSLHTASPDSSGRPQAYPPSRWPAPDTPLSASSFSNLPDTGRNLPSTRHADPGVDLKVKMMVTPRPLHHVTGVASTSESSNAAPIVYPEPRFGESFPLSNIESANGRIDFWLPDGEYVLQAVSPVEWARFPLTVAGQDVAGIEIRTHRTVSVPIRVVGPGASDSLESPSKVPFGFNLALMEETPAGVVNGAGVSSAHSKGDDFLVEYLLPGNYMVTTQSSSSAYVSSITAGSLDLNTHPYVVPDAGIAPPISVELRTDGGALSGVVHQGGQPVGAYLYAIPILPTTAAPLRTLSRPDGTYRLEGIPPGAYRIVALEYDEQIPYREHNALRPWLLRGRPVSVEPNSVGVLDLEAEYQ